MKLVFGGEETYIACGICRFCTRTETRDVVIPLLLPIVKHVVVLIIVLPRGGGDRPHLVHWFLLRFAKTLRYAKPRNFYCSQGLKYVLIEKAQ